jgi:diguanylate cyclase (GGDEF)-like protein
VSSQAGRPSPPTRTFVCRPVTTLPWRAPEAEPDDGAPPRTQEAAPSERRLPGALEAQPRVEASGIPEPGGWDDALTGLEGPDFWRRVLVAEVARAARYKRDLAVIVSELEGVLQVVETWGPDVGRHAIREAGQCIRRTSRTSDYCTRIGLTRFGIVLTETDEIAAINFVERVREAGPRSMPRGVDGLRFSFGWASPQPGESPDAIVRRAERRLMAELLPGA